MAAHPNENWMASCSARTKLTPMQFVFPGTHDSGAYQRPDFNIVATKQPMSSSLERFTPAFQELAARWAMSQPGQSLYDQMMNGVRYLDLRVSYATDPKTGKWTWYLIHTFVVCTLETALDDIARFLSSHPSELAYLDIGFYYKAFDHMREFQSYFISKLGKFMYPDVHSGKMPDTVDAITKQGKQIIACLGIDDLGLRSNLRFFVTKQVCFLFPFKSVDNVAAKHAYIKEGLEAYGRTSKTLLYELPFTLTEVSLDVAMSVFTNASLKQLADKMNPTLVPFVSSLTKAQRSYINLLECDDQVNSLNVHVAMMLLAERVSDLEPVARPLSLQNAALPVKQGAPQAACAGADHCSAWCASSSEPQKSSSNGRVVVPTQHRRQTSSPLRRVLCCCLCCGRKAQSDDEDDAPLMRY